MHEPITLTEELSPDVSHLVTEDDEPVDNLPSEKQQRLLTETLYSSWKGPSNAQEFLVAANVGLFYSSKHPSIVPDVFLSLDVQIADDWWEKRHRCYFFWEFGKPPELADTFHSLGRNRIGGVLVDRDGPRIDRVWLP